ncbi:MAG: 4'-phosphopantetheinyl transferase [Acinetobacter tjernbergiae]
MISSRSKYLGIDLEYIVATSFAEESMQLILTQFEQELWQTGKIEHLSFCEYLTLIFSLKESLYKAVFPVAQSYIDFLEATVVEIDIKRQMVRLKFSQEIQQRYKLRFEYQGFWVFQQDHVITWVAK